MYAKKTRVETHELIRALVDERIAAVVGDVQPPRLQSALRSALQDGKRVRPLLTMMAAASAGRIRRRSSTASAARTTPAATCCTRRRAEREGCQSAASTPPPSGPSNRS